MSAAAERIRRVLGLHAGEGATVALMMAVAFFASAGIMIAQSAIDALFFARYGVDRLPVLYLLVGVAMFATTLGVGALLARVGRAQAFLLILVAISLTAAAGRAAVEFGVGWVYGALWLAYSVAEFTQLLAVWGMAGLVSDTRQAKRFFPVIAAGGVLGLILGGAATAPLAAAFGSENLLLVWGLLTALSAVAGWRLIRARAAAALAPPRTARRRPGGGLTDGLRDVRSSALLRWMSAGALLMALMFSLLYLPFSAAAVERYPDPDQLAGFFGLFFAAAMGTGLVLSLLVTGRLLTRFGVPVVILVLPILYLVAFGVLAVAAAFATLTLFRFAQVSWMSGGASSTWEALVNTIPAERRDRVRAFLYGVPKQLGTISAGLIALVAQQLEEPRLLYGAGLVAAALAVLVMQRVRGAYPAALVSALREGRPVIFAAGVGPRPIGVHADATSLALLNELLGDPDPGVRRLGAHALGELDLPAAEASLAWAAEDPDAEVRATSLQALETRGATPALDVARARSGDPDSNVRLIALGVLARHGTAPPESALDDEDVRVRATAAAMLLGRDPRADAALATVARAADPRTRAAAMSAIAAAPSRRAADLAADCLHDSDPRVRAAAAGAIAAAAPEDALDPLLAALADTDAAVRRAAAAATAVLRPRTSAVADALLDEKRRDGALHALEQLPVDGAAAQIRQAAEEAVQRALEDEQLRVGLGTDESDDVVSLLRASLRARAERHAHDALRAAALLGDRTAVSAALGSLGLADPAQRATALEVIETVGEPTIVRPLLALWEPRTPGRADPQALDRLRTDTDDWIRACAEHVSPPTRSGGTMTRTLTTVPVVERVVFLRKAPLFATLPPQDLRPIAEIAEEHVFAEGDTIADRGEPGDTMYIIVEGEVAVLAADDHELGVRGPGEVIGEMAVISSRPRVASLVARAPVRVLELRKPAFEAILRERPETALAMMRVLCERIAPQGAT